jgi:RHS repeat-associated protein
MGLPRLAWHYACDEVCLGSPDEAPPPELQTRETAGEPVDLFTGRFIATKTDLLLPGLVPIRLERQYWSGSTRPGFFGIGWNPAPYDTRLTTFGTSMMLIQPDQSRLVFAPDGPDRWINASAPALLGAVLTRLPGEFDFQLRLKNGMVHRFERIIGFAEVAGLAAITDRNGNTARITRDSFLIPGVFGLITQITEPGGRSLALSYDAAGRISAVTDPIGRLVQYTYDGQGRLDTVTDPVGGVTRYAYDPAHRLVSITDPRGFTFITNEYDATGRVVRQVQADGAVWGFAYAAIGTTTTQTVVTDPGGNATMHRFSTQGLTLSTTDALGQTTTYEYAPGSNLLVAITDPLGRTTRVTYDGRGNVSRATDPGGNTTTFAYEPNFDSIVSVTGPTSSTVQFERDTRGNITGVVDATGGRTVIVHDAQGQPVSVTDPSGHSTSYTYDAVGNPATIADPLGNVTRLSYDTVSRVIARADPLGRTTRFSYDGLNRLVGRIDPVSGTTGVTYDGNGNVVTITDPRGETTTHTHDSMDRLLTRTHPGGGVEQYEYDIAGNPARYTDRNGRIVLNEYDARRRRVTTTYSDGAVTRMTYDAVGRALVIADSTSGAIQYEYDPGGRLLKQVSVLGTVAYAYDALDRRTLLTTPGAPPVSYAYDANSRLTQVQQGSRTVQLEYDAVGRQTRLTLPNGVVTEYQYDAASRLTDLTYRNSTDVLGTLTYGFDSVGNLTAQGGTLARTALPNPVGSAAYEPESRQVMFGDRSVAYDPSGNPTTISDATGLTTLQWDSRNRLIGLVGPAGNASFVYDAVGRRIVKVINNVTTQFLYDGPDATQQIVDGQPTAYLRLLLVDSPLARGDSDYYLTDRLGSTLALTDASGAITTRYVYEPFGLATHEGAHSDNALQFTGRENDGTGLLYYRARYYAPTLHRFLGQDLLPGLGDNRYVYIGSNPLGGIDPFGLETIIINGGLPSYGPGGSSAGPDPVNPGLRQIAARLEDPRRGVNERVLPVLNSGQTAEAYQQACGLKKSGRPVHIIGHSLGGRAALAIAQRLVSDCGFAPDHVFTIDPYEAPDVKAPPGVPVTNFFQRRSWWFQGPEVEGAAANIFVPGTFHLNITQHESVKVTIEQTIIESRGIGESSGGRY